MKHSILICISLWLSLASHAASGTGELTYVKRIPSAMKASLPRGGKTLLCGKAPSGFGQRETWVHLFSTVSKRSAPKSGSEAIFMFNPKDYVLNVWERENSSHPMRFRLVNSVQFSGAEYLRGISGNREFSFIKSYVSWLRPSTQQTPVIRVQVEAGNGVNAHTDGADILFVFKGGFRSQPHLQQFKNYFLSDGVAFHSFDRTDPQGVLIVKKTSWVQKTDQNPVETYYQFQWDGQKFVERPDDREQQK